MPKEQEWPTVSYTITYMRNESIQAKNKLKVILIVIYIYEMLSLFDNYVGDGGCIKFTLVTWVSKDIEINSPYSVRADTHWEHSLPYSHHWETLALLGYWIHLMHCKIH